ncbi:hypothetical protein CRUP_037014, partial [Coryphaenoides rupestris]
MEKSLNSFFEKNMEEVFEIEDSPDKKDAGPAVKKKQKISHTSQEGDCIDLTTTMDEPACSSSSRADAAEPPEQKAPPEDDKKLSMISWNVDGLDTDNLQQRARGLCSYLVLYTPDVIFLQELIPPYVEYLKKRAISYTLIAGGEEGYFTGIMLKTSRVKLQGSQIVPYTTTQMMRNLLIA